MDNPFGQLIQQLVTQFENKYQNILQSPQLLPQYSQSPQPQSLLRQSQQQQQQQSPSLFRNAQQQQQPQSLLRQSQQQRQAQLDPVVVIQMLKRDVTHCVDIVSNTTVTFFREIFAPEVGPSWVIECAREVIRNVVVSKTAKSIMSVYQKLVSLLTVFLLLVVGCVASFIIALTFGLIAV